jgi:uncharacterized phage-associated protein
MFTYISNKPQSDAEGSKRGYSLIEFACKISVYRLWITLGYGRSEEIKMTTHSAISVADYILDKARERGHTLTPMQVLKLVYLCHGWMLGLYGRPLIDEYVEAWQYGPVVRSLYSAVKRFRASPVQGPLSVGPEHFSPEEKNIMDQVVDLYGHFTGPQLSQLTHASNTPWRCVWDGGDTIIPNELIQQHFEELASNQKARASA